MESTHAQPGEHGGEDEYASVERVTDPHPIEPIVTDAPPLPAATPPSGVDVGGGEADAYREQLRALVLEHLRSQGFHATESGILSAVPEDKDTLRQLHAQAVAERQAVAEGALRRYEEEFILRLAHSDHIQVRKIRPRLILIEDRRSQDGLFWRWASLHWSVPVSAGYGRRLRYLVVDAAHKNALIGLIGLGDPVFALRCRDRWIGWSKEHRAQRLACILDAFVLGAVPPYSGLLGGKLIALLATSKAVRDTFARRYGHKRSLIADRDPNAKLALVTTSSALGRSSIYNRITDPDGHLAWHPIGFTAGSGDFHLSGSLYTELARYAAAVTEPNQTYRHERWPGGSSFRNRREVVQRALESLGLASRKFRIHGVERQVFAAPLAHNTREFLRGETKQLDWRCRGVRDLASYWRDRWALPRLERTGMPDFDPASWRLWPQA